MLRRLLWFPMGILLFFCIWAMAQAIVYHQSHPSLPTFIRQPQTGTVSTESISQQLPLVLPDAKLMIEALVTYEGPFLEDLSDEETVTAGIILRNLSNETVTFARIEGVGAEGIFTFDVTYLPPGARVLIGELNRDSLPLGVLTWRCISLSTQPETNTLSEITVYNEGRCSLSVTNSGDAPISHITVYYKQYVPQEDMFIGGITYRTVLTDLKAHETRNTSPYHFVEGYSKIVFIKKTQA